jgi:hypothetical protein
MIARAGSNVSRFSDMDAGPAERGQETCISAHSPRLCAWAVPFARGILRAIDGSAPGRNPCELVAFDGNRGAGPSLIEYDATNWSHGMARRARRSKARKKVSKLPKVVLQTRVAPGAEYKRVLAIALALPGVEESTAYGTPGLRVKGKILARLRTEADGALALRCDFLDRQILLQADPDAFFVTDHYLNYPMILVRLKRVRKSALRDLIERAWRMVAPAKLVAEHEAQGRTAKRKTADTSRA